MVMKFSKSDFWKAAAAGEAIALLIIPVSKNLKVFALVQSWSGNLMPLFIALWLIFLPIAAASGLYIFYRLSVLRWPILFQIGKYGIVGWLNTFFAAGILNFLVWATGTAQGFWLDCFAAAAFVLGTINSFFWNKFWTFESKNTDKIKQEYVRFFAVSAAVSLLNTGLIHLIVNIIGPPAGFDPEVWVNVAIAIIIPVAFLGNFLGYRIFVFNNKRKEYEEHNGI